MKHFALILILIAAACSTPSSVSPISVPLKYKAMAGPADVPTMQSCSAVSKIEITDAREDKNIGKRFVEGKSAATAAVTTPDDVVAWVQGGAEAVLKRAGVTVGTAGAPVLHLTIDQIATSENVLHRSGYEGRIGLSAELRPASGAACWKGSGDGLGENYGYAGSIENYQETLNHALDRAVLKILGDRDFKKAICSCGA